MRLADPGAGVLRLGDELLEVGGREILARHDQDRRAGRQADRLEVLGRVVFEVGIERGRRAVRAHVPHHDRVAVRLRLRAARDAGGAAGAGDVLDDELLAERLREVFADDAGDDVGRSAGGERHDDGDRTGRVVLRKGGRRGRAPAPQQDAVNKPFHRSLPSVQICLISIRSDRCSPDADTVINVLNLGMAARAADKVKRWSQRGLLLECLLAALAHRRQHRDHHDRQREQAAARRRSAAPRRS